MENLKNDYSIKITKKILLKEGLFNLNYYLIYGKIYNHKKTLSRNFKFIVNYDDFDLYDYFEKDNYSKEDVKCYIDELIFSYTNLINNFDDVKKFYDACDNSIIDYNKTLKGLAL